MKCTNCDREIKYNFCTNCGAIISYPKEIAGEKKREIEYSKKVREIVTNVSHIRTTAKAKHVDNERIYNLLSFEEMIRKQCSNEEIHHLIKAEKGNLFAMMNKYVQTCNENTCQIAFIGSIKAGKSCLINALLDCELASVNFIPETAALTRFKSSPNNYLKATFYTPVEWNELWKSVQDKKETDAGKVFIEKYRSLNADMYKSKYVGHIPEIKETNELSKLKDFIANYSSAKSPIHYFVKDLEVGLKDLNIPGNVEFVDTPGLNDPISYRSEITREYLQSANVVLLCIKARSLEETDIELLSKLFSDMRYNVNRVYILGTQYDIYSNAKETWNGFLNNNWMDFLKSKGFYGDEKLAREHIFHISPFLYTLYKKIHSDNNKFLKLNEADQTLIVNSLNNLLGINNSSNQYIVDNKNELKTKIVELQKEQGEKRESLNSKINKIKNEITGLRLLIEDKKNEKKQQKELKESLRNKGDKMLIPYEYTLYTNTDSLIDKLDQEIDEIDNKIAEKNEEIDDINNAMNKSDNEFIIMENNLREQINAVDNQLSDIVSDSDSTKSLKRLNFNYERLLECTNVLNFKKLIFEGPVQQSETLIIDHVVNLFKNISDDIKEASTQIREDQIKTIESSKEKDYKKLIQEIEASHNIASKQLSELNRCIKKLDEVPSIALERINKL
ncbi:MAG: dynamin family protein [Bacteroidota bacterium]